MADDRVDVIFGARVSELLSGIGEATEAIEGFRGIVE
jgi:hypothetical protein